MCVNQQKALQPILCKTFSKIAMILRKTEGATFDTAKTLEVTFFCKSLKLQQKSWNCVAECLTHMHGCTSSRIKGEEQKRANTAHLNKSNSSVPLLPLFSHNEIQFGK